MKSKNDIAHLRQIMSLSYHDESQKHTDEEGLKEF